MKTFAPYALAALLASCTPGGMFASTAGGGVPGGGQITRIDVNLTLHSGQTQLPAGSAAGYAPIPVNVSVGSLLQFVNSDSFAHTASEITGAAAVPQSSPLHVSAQTRSGSALSTGFSSGTLAPGQSSQLVSVDAPGTYLYGCFFHYGGPMRGEIVAK